MTNNKIFLYSATNIRTYSEAWLFLQIWEKYGKYKPSFANTEEFVKIIARKKLIINPFRKDDTKPSLKLFYWHERLRFLDYGDQSYNGDIFDIMGKALNDVGDRSWTFGQLCDLLKKIIIDSEETILTKAQELKIHDTFKRERLEWSIKQMALRQVDLDYFKQYGITEQTLLKNNVKGIDSIHRNGTLLYSHTLIDLNNDPMVMYEYTEQQWQVYRPQSVKNIKWINWVGHLLLNSCTLDKKYRNTLITKSTKDCMLLRQIAEELGVFDVSITNVITESQELSDQLLKLLITYNKSITLLYDNDNIGRQRSSEIQVQFNNLFPNNNDLLTIKFVESEKDISDYCRTNGYDKTKLFVESILCKS